MWRLIRRGAFGGAIALGLAVLGLDFLVDPSDAKEDVKGTAALVCFATLVGAFAGAIGGLATKGADH